MLRIRRLLFLLFGLIVVLPLGGLLYQSGMTWWNRDRFAAPGEMISLEGRSLHVMCEGTAGPTVILEAGLGGDAILVWKSVVRGLRDQARVCYYDRAGYGWSDTGPKPRSLDALASDLSIVVEHLAPDVPVVLAGHSLGGMIVRQYAKSHQDKVAGILLIDSSHEEQVHRLPKKRRKGFNFYMFSVQEGAAFGLPRWFAREWTPRSDFADLTDQEYERLVELMSLASYHRAVEDEYYDALVNPDMTFEPGMLGDVPLIVQSRDTIPTNIDEEDRAEAAVWASLQQEQMSLSTRSRFQLVEGAGHGIPDTHPEAVIAALQELSAEVRQKIEASYE